MSNGNDQSKIMKCDCKHEFQDQTYGKGMRVHNPAPQKGASPQRMRCTVCRKERNIDNKQPSL